VFTPSDPSMVPPSTELMLQEGLFCLFFVLWRLGPWMPTGTEERVDEFIPPSNRPDLT